jgi:hypothetical protein
VLVGDLADDLLEDVLDGDQPGEAAVLVDCACMSRSNSSTGLDSGTKVGGRMSSSTFGPLLLVPLRSVLFCDRRTRSLR